MGDRARWRVGTGLAAATLLATCACSGDPGAAEREGQADVPSRPSADPGPTSGERLLREARRVGAPPARQRAPHLRGDVVGGFGVVSYNALRHLPLRRARRDWDRLTSRPDVDLIGWQEAKSPEFRSLAPQYRERGWETWRWPDPDGPISLAFSWRSRAFALLDVDFTRMHDGGYPRETTDPFPARWVVEARFRHRPTGRIVTLLDTHVNQHIETGRRFQRNLNARRAKQHLRRLAGLWTTTPGDVVVGTGDYNFDHADDAEARPAGGITRRFAGRATSSYEALGLDLLPTRNTRWIDYVFLADRTRRRESDRPGRGAAGQLAWHRVLPGYSSDHRPLLARVRIYDAS